MSEQPSLDRLGHKGHTYELMAKRQKRGFRNLCKTKRMYIVAPKMVLEKVEGKVRGSVGVRRARETHGVM